MITPATSIQIPWRIAQATKSIMRQTIISMEWIGDFWNTWSQVYRGDR